MSATCDPIADLGWFGYTEREAAFLYMTGIHSGYFLRRQFLTFLGREDGAIVQRFLRKSIQHGHVQPIEYATGRHLYHLKAKSIYRILGEEDSQHRRAKGDRWIKARLMQVDYVLNHLGDPLLETTEQKISFFHERLKIPVDVLPQANFASSGRPVYFPDGFPITIKQKADQHILRSRWFSSTTACVRSPHSGAGLSSTPDFSRHFMSAKSSMPRRPNGISKLRSVSSSGDFLLGQTPRNVNGMSTTSSLISKSARAMKSRAGDSHWKKCESFPKG